MFSNLKDSLVSLGNATISALHSLEKHEQQQQQQQQTLCSCHTAPTATLTCTGHCPACAANSHACLDSIPTPHVNPPSPILALPA